MTAAQGFFTLEKPHEAENPENSLFFSRELDLETGFAWLHPPPAGPAEPSIFVLVPDTPFVPGFPLSVLAPFGLCRRSLSLEAILVAQSPHPKIPFLAEKVSG